MARPGLRAGGAVPRLAQPGQEPAAGARAALHCERFIDSAPAEVSATLLDEGTYLGSVSTMYRTLHQVGQVRERRAHSVHPASVKPELVAHAPHQMWSWDITKSHGPAKWTYFYLYVIFDIFSRYVVGWRLAPHERATLAKLLFDDSIGKHPVDRDQLTLHADLGATKSHSRPHVPNDNPFSESQFKTLKYRPDFPKTFDTMDQAREYGPSTGIWTKHGNTASSSSGGTTSSTVTPGLDGTPRTVSTGLTTSAGPSARRAVIPLHIRP